VRLCTDVQGRLYEFNDLAIRAVKYARHHDDYSHVAVRAWE
jgi:hypothetical protein